MSGTCRTVVSGYDLWRNDVYHVRLFTVEVESSFNYYEGTGWVAGQSFSGTTSVAGRAGQWRMTDVASATSSAAGGLMTSSAVRLQSGGRNPFRYGGAFLGGAPTALVLVDHSVDAAGALSAVASVSWSGFHLGLTYGLQENDCTTIGLMSSSFAFSGGKE
jgi:hypothetical protein